MASSQHIYREDGFVACLQEATLCSGHLASGSVTVPGKVRTAGQPPRDTCFPSRRRRGEDLEPTSPSRSHLCRSPPRGPLPAFQRSTAMRTGTADCSSSPHPHHSVHHPTRHVTPLCPILRTNDVLHRDESGGRSYLLFPSAPPHRFPQSLLPRRLHTPSIWL